MKVTPIAPAFAAPGGLRGIALVALLLLTPAHATPVVAGKEFWNNLDKHQPTLTRTYGGGNTKTMSLVSAKGDVMCGGSNCNFAALGLGRHSMYYTAAPHETHKSCPWQLIHGGKCRKNKLWLPGVALFALFPHLPPGAAVLACHTGGNWYSEPLIPLPSPAQFYGHKAKPCENKAGEKVGTEALAVLIHENWLPYLAALASTKIPLATSYSAGQSAQCRSALNRAASALELPPRLWTQLTKQITARVLPRHKVSASTRGAAIRLADSIDNLLHDVDDVATATALAASRAVSVRAAKLLTAKLVASEEHDKHDAEEVEEEEEENADAAAGVAGPAASTLDVTEWHRAFPTRAHHSHTFIRTNAMVAAYQTVMKVCVNGCKRDFPLWIAETYGSRTAAKPATASLAESGLMSKVKHVLGYINGMFKNVDHRIFFLQHAGAQKENGLLFIAMEKLTSVVIESSAILADTLVLQGVPNRKLSAMRKSLSPLRSMICDLWKAGGGRGGGKGRNWCPLWVFPPDSQYQTLKNAVGFPGSIQQSTGASGRTGTVLSPRAPIAALAAGGAAHLLNERNFGNVLLISKKTASLPTDLCCEEIAEARDDTVKRVGVQVSVAKQEIMKYMPLIQGTHYTEDDLNRVMESPWHSLMLGQATAWPAFTTHITPTKHSSEPTNDARPNPSKPQGSINALSDATFGAAAALSFGNTQTELAHNACAAMNADAGSEYKCRVLKHRPWALFADAASPLSKAKKKATCDMVTQFLAHNNVYGLNTNRQMLLTLMVFCGDDHAVDIAAHAKSTNFFKQLDEMALMPMCDTSTDDCWVTFGATTGDVKALARLMSRVSAQGNNFCPWSATLKLDAQFLLCKTPLQGNKFKYDYTCFAEFPFNDKQIALRGSVGQLAKEMGYISAALKAMVALHNPLKYFEEGAVKLDEAVIYLGNANGRNAASSSTRAKKCVREVCNTVRDAVAQWQKPRGTEPIASKMAQGMWMSISHGSALTQAVRTETQTLLEGCDNAIPQVPTLTRLGNAAALTRLAAALRRLRRKITDHSFSDSELRPVHMRGIVVGTTVLRDLLERSLDALDSPESPVNTFLNAHRLVAESTSEYDRMKADSALYVIQNMNDQAGLVAADEERVAAIKQTWIATGVVTDTNSQVLHLIRAADDVRTKITHCLNKHTLIAKESCLMYTLYRSAMYPLQDTEKELLLKSHTSDSARKLFDGVNGGFTGLPIIGKYSYYSPGTGHAATNMIKTMVNIFLDSTVVLDEIRAMGSRRAAWVPSELSVPALALGKRKLTKTFERYLELPRCQSDDGVDLCGCGASICSRYPGSTTLMKLCYVTGDVPTKMIECIPDLWADFIESPFPLLAKLVRDLGVMMRFVRKTWMSPISLMDRFPFDATLYSDGLGFKTFDGGDEQAAHHVMWRIIQRQAHIWKLTMGRSSSFKPDDVVDDGDTAAVPVAAAAADGTGGAAAAAAASNGGASSDGGGAGGDAGGGSGATFARFEWYGSVTTSVNLELSTLYNVWLKGGGEPLPSDYMFEGGHIDMADSFRASNRHNEAAIADVHRRVNRAQAMKLTGATVGVKPTRYDVQPSDVRWSTSPPPDPADVVEMKGRNGAVLVNTKTKEKAWINLIWRTKRDAAKRRKNEMEADRRELSHVLAITAWMENCMRRDTPNTHYLELVPPEDNINMPGRWTTKKKTGECPWRCMLLTEDRVTALGNLEFVVDTENPNTKCKPFIHFRFLKAYAEEKRREKSGTRRPERSK